MNHDALAHWIAGYERAWRTAGTELIPDLFTPTATYRPGPFDPEVRGLEQLAAFWEAEREGPDEVFAMEWDAVAIEDDVAVARVEVRYGDPPTRTYRDLWIMRFDEDRRCAEFEEWPFFPGQPLSATTDDA
ncbi:MAG TPA: nuclear transport factor 2 family protein [Solirubrobacteraceae bacterium]